MFCVLCSVFHRGIECGRVWGVKVVISEAKSYFKSYQSTIILIGALDNNHKQSTSFIIMWLHYPKGMGNYSDFNVIYNFGFPRSLNQDNQDKMSGMPHVITCKCCMCVPEWLPEHKHMQWNPGQVGGIPVMSEFLKSWSGKRFHWMRVHSAKATLHVCCVPSHPSTPSECISEQTEVLLRWTTEVVRPLTTKNSQIIA